MEFAEQNDQYCINPLSWNGVVVEEFTLQREMGNNVIRSIIYDYGIASKGVLAATMNFRIIDE